MLNLYDCLMMTLQEKTYKYFGCNNLKEFQGTSHVSDQNYVLFIYLQLQYYNNMMGQKLLQALQ